ncbi:CotH kinase family protein, partial [Candidatus Falkowbacteria bacterium]|nr:CotH kinase family protein [Candidatus Falkowbacteria bacterium]
MPGFIKKAILVIVVLGLGAGFFAGVFAMEYYDGNDKLASVVYERVPGLTFLTRSYKMLDVLYFWSFFQKRKLSVYELEIDPDNLRALEENIPDISQVSWEGSELKKQTVNGVLRYEGKEYKVSVRFRGDSPVHWAYPKKSWRVKIDKDEVFEKGFINGMREFNFIVGEDRSFISEQLNNYRASKLGLLTPPSEFVDLKINGKHQGAYYLSEQWGEEFLERNKIKSDINLYGESALLGLVDENMFTYLENFRKYTED